MSALTRYDGSRATTSVTVCQKCGKDSNHVGVNTSFYEGNCESHHILCFACYATHCLAETTTKCPIDGCDDPIGSFELCISSPHLMKLLIDLASSLHRANNRVEELCKAVEEMDIKNKNELRNCTYLQCPICTTHKRVVEPEFAAKFKKVVVDESINLTRIDDSVPQNARQWRNTNTFKRIKAHAKECYKARNPGCVFKDSLLPPFFWPVKDFPADVRREMNENRRKEKERFKASLPQIADGRRDNSSDESMVDESSDDEEASDDEEVSLNHKDDQVSPDSSHNDNMTEEEADEDSPLDAESVPSLDAESVGAASKSPCIARKLTPELEGELDENDSNVKMSGLIEELERSLPRRSGHFHDGGGQPKKRKVPKLPLNSARADN